MRIVALFALLFATVGCWGSNSAARSYYVLHGVTASSMVGRPIDGLVRVRNLDADTVYEKFQIVVRQNPYQLQYDEDNIWAVKPSQMIADVIARALNDSKRFTAVARELGELRPNYILSGRLQAVEVYDSDDHWYAHLSLSLRLTEFSTGRTLHTANFDERRPLAQRSYAQAARAISELLSTAIDELVQGLEKIDVPRAEGYTPATEVIEPDVEPPPDPDSVGPEDPPPGDDGTIFVPERE
jgi:ABC-type uncharacterized transport system auxiliary subunit